MKTYRELLSQLPEPYKDKALRNAGQFTLSSKPSKQDLQHCLLGAFNWKKSPEGHDYWQKVLESIP